MGRRLAEVAAKIESTSEEQDERDGRRREVEDRSRDGLPLGGNGSDDAHAGRRRRWF